MTTTMQKAAGATNANGLHNHTNRADSRTGAAAGQAQDGMAVAMPIAKHSKCARIVASLKAGPVRKNTLKQAVATPTESGVLSCPNSAASRDSFAAMPKGFGWGGSFRKDGRTTCFVFLTPHPPYALKNADGGFQSRQGAETMTTVITPTTPTGTPPFISYLLESTNKVRDNGRPPFSFDGTTILQGGAA